MSISLGKFLPEKARKSSDVAEVAQVAGLAVAARVGKIARRYEFLYEPLLYLYTMHVREKNGEIKDESLFYRQLTEY